MNDQHNKGNQDMGIDPQDFEQLAERTNEQVIQSIFESFVQNGRLADEVEYQLRSMGHDDLSQDQRKKIIDRLNVNQDVKIVVAEAS